MELMQTLTADSGFIIGIAAALITYVASITLAIEKNGDVRAESALQLSSFVRFDIYAKTSKVRCAWDFAPCHGPGYRTKRDIF